MTTPRISSDTADRSSDRATYFVGRDTLVVRVDPGSGTEQFATTVETFGDATQVACRTLVLDLSGVDRINSDLLGLLLWAHGRLRLRGAELVIARPSRATREVLARSGLDFVLTMSNDLPVAAA